MGGTTRKPHNPGAWPYWLRAATAAAFTDEESVESFLRGVGTIYPEPENVPGKGRRWRRESLEQAIDKLSRAPSAVSDLASEL